MKTAYREEIKTASNKYNLNPNIIEAIVIIESAGQTTAYRYEPTFWTKYLSNNPKYANSNPSRVSASYGLMQIMYIVAVEIGYNLEDPEYLFIPAFGLEYGCLKFKSLINWARGNTNQALAAYNGGKRANTKPPYRNQSYVDKVMRELVS